MSTPKLQLKIGKPVAAWSVEPAQLKALLEAKAPKAEKITLPAAGTKPSELRALPEKFIAADLLVAERWWPGYFCAPRYRVRKNQKNLTPIEWQRFIHAIETLAVNGMPAPTYHDFVQIHMDAMDTMAGMAWGAHGGTNFLSWHREYLAKLEARLMAVNPLVTIPYWDWVTDRTAIPAALSNPADLALWGITRGASFNGNSLASAAQLNALLAGTNFNAFRNTLEAAPFHNRLHVLVGGTMVSSASPADPLFWLHHAFIDKIWADWEALHPGVNPSNLTDVLLPPPIMTRTVTQVLDTHALGYIYA